MANFLSNLVNRFNSKAEVVQTRPASLFEPQTNIDLSAWAGTHHPSGEVEEIREQPDPLQTSASSFHLPARSIDESQPLGDRGKSHQISSNQSGKKSKTSHPPAQLGYLVVEPRFQADQTTRGQISKFESDVQGDGSPLVPQRGAYQEEGTPPQGAQVSIRPKETYQQPGQKTVIQPKPREAPESLKAVHDHLSNERKRDFSPAEQVINVTIGRVEVQAVPPASSKKTAKHPQSIPVMSLDEYLESRDQERQS